MTTHQPPYLVRKIVVAGDAGVGKSSLFLAYVERSFRPLYECTISCEFSSKMVTVGDMAIKLQMWDTAGQERFRCLTRSYFRGAHVCIMVFEQGNQTTLDNLMTEWRESVAAAPGVQTLVVVESKMDLSTPDSELVRKQARAYCEKHDIPMFSVSSKTMTGIDELFKTVAELSVEGDVLLHRKRRARQAGTTLRILWAKESRRFAGVPIGRDVLGILVNAVHKTAREECWGLPSTPPSNRNVAVAAKPNHWKYGVMRVVAVCGFIFALTSGLLC